MQVNCRQFSQWLGSNLGLEGGYRARSGKLRIYFKYMHLVTFKHWVSSLFSNSTGPDCFHFQTCSLQTCSLQTQSTLTRHSKWHHLRTFIRLEPQKASYCSVFYRKGFHMGCTVVIAGYVCWFTGRSVDKLLLNFSVLQASQTKLHWGGG